MVRTGAVALLATLGLLLPRPCPAAGGKGKLRPVLVLKGFKKIEILEDGKVFVAIHPGGRVEAFGRTGEKAQGRLFADGRFVGPRGKMTIRLLPDGKLVLVRGKTTEAIPLQIDPSGKLTNLTETKWPPAVIGPDGALAGGNPRNAKRTARIRVRGVTGDASRRLAMFVLAALLTPVNVSPPPAAAPAGTPARKPAK